MTSPRRPRLGSTHSTQQRSDSTARTPHLGAPAARKLPVALPSYLHPSAQARRSGTLPSNMAKKYGWFKLQAPFLANISIMLLIGAGLIVFQQLCLNNPDSTFLSGDVCLADSNSRALIAAALTVSTAVISKSVQRTAVAFRTAKLSSGIPEGVFVALGSNALWNSYIVRAVISRGRWAAPVTLFVLALHSQNVVQTASNLGIHGSQVYVPNAGSANVFDTVSYYNVSNFTVPPFHTSEGSAVSVLSKMQQFRNSAVSTLVNGTTVVTSALRDDYINSVNHTLEDNTNAFRHDEVVATLGSTCNLIEYTGPASGLISDTTSTFNMTYSPDFAGLYVYDASVAVVSPTELVIESRFGQPVCSAAGQCQPLLPSTPVRGIIAECVTTVSLAVQTIIYTVSTDNARVVQFQSNDTTVDINDFAGLLSEYAASPEGAAAAENYLPYEVGYVNVITSFPNGIFNNGQPNVLHARFCAAASLALGLLWEEYGSGATSTGNLSSDAVVGNQFLLYDKNIPLYNLVIQTYVSTRSMALIVGTVVGFTLLVCFVGMVFAHQSPINLKDPLDISLLPNVDDGIMNRKRYTVGASNDPQLQCSMAFDPAALLFCREADSYTGPPPDPFKGNAGIGLTAHSNNGVPAHDPQGFSLVTAKRVAITYGTAQQPPPGVLPDALTDYL